MNAIAHALKEVRHSIPPAILQYAFVNNRAGNKRTVVSIDSIIREEVINARVLPDCNITGGTLEYIPISNLPYKETNSGARIYKISKALTAGRTIYSVLSVGEDAYCKAYVDSSQGIGNRLVDRAQRVSESFAPAEFMHTTDVALENNNTVVVNAEVHHWGTNFHLICKLGYDDELSAIPARAYRNFSELVVRAVKAYIYNQTIVSIGAGAVMGGVELGTFRELIDSYADSNELYSEYLRTVWQKVALMGDKASKKRHIRAITPLA